MEFVSLRPDDLDQHAARLLGAWKTARIFAFFGPLGAGKTTFIQSICRLLGVMEAVTSPTFSLVHAYQSPNGPVYHFDLYRLRDEAEAIEIGFDEYLDSGQFCLVEWPDRAVGLLPEEVVFVRIQPDALTGHRLIAAEYGKN